MNEKLKYHLTIVAPYLSIMLSIVWALITHDSPSFTLKKSIFIFTFYRSKSGGGLALDKYDFS